MVQFLKKHAVLGLLFLGALTIALFFLVRLTVSTHKWSDTRLTDPSIAGWMTPRYVSRSWQVPPEVVAQALGLEMDGSGRRVTLAELAAQQGRDLDTLIAEVEAVIEAARFHPP
ncbi:hypothetical protein [Puniceibacterium sediminis]|uniref:hypothetical protein n=1 Tax=Puniceibacterium sediminis TaxID=1608407 RepID=UPI000B787B5B|nr:hypothetical protein [Puniceibacterium sediminis]